MSAPQCSLSSCARRSSDCAFQVAWAINPHMRVGSVHSGHAVRQHRALVRTLQAAGAVVDAVPFVHGAFDSVFAKDNALLVERSNGAIEALLARPRYRERQLEQGARAAAFRALGMRVDASCDAALEGGDVVTLPGARGAFLGYGFRSDRRAEDALARFLGHGVDGVELTDPRLYHLDMVLAILDDGTALVCEEALTRAARDMIESHPAVRSVVRVPFDEAMRFGVNLVQVGRTIALAGDAPQTATALRDRGYRVRRLVLDQFHRAGGSAACLVSRVHRPSSATRRSSAEPAAA